MKRLTHDEITKTIVQEAFQREIKSAQIRVEETGQVEVMQCPTWMSHEQVLTVVALTTIRLTSRWN